MYASVVAFKIGATENHPAVVGEVDVRTRKFTVRLRTSHATTSAGEDLLAGARTLAALGNPPGWYATVLHAQQTLHRAPYASVEEVLDYVLSTKAARLAEGRDDVQFDFKTIPAWKWWAYALDPLADVRKTCAAWCPKAMLDGQLGTLLAGDPVARMHVQNRVKDFGDPTAHQLGENPGLGTIDNAITKFTDALDDHHRAHGTEKAQFYFNGTPAVVHLGDSASTVYADWNERRTTYQRAVGIAV